jgi:hypothetical protein
VEDRLAARRAGRGRDPLDGRPARRLRLRGDVYDALYPTNRQFTSADIKAFIAKRPDLATYGGDRRG